jgi:hypothetical protein
MPNFLAARADVVAVSFLRTVEVGEAGELVHHADQGSVGRSGQPGFEGLGPFGLDQLRGDSVCGHRSTVAYQAPSAVVDVSPGVTAGPGTRSRDARLPWTTITRRSCW